MVIDASEITWKHAFKAGTLLKAANLFGATWANSPMGLTCVVNCSGLSIFVFIW